MAACWLFVEQQTFQSYLAWSIEEEEAYKEEKKTGRVWAGESRGDAMEEIRGRWTVEMEKWCSDVGGDGGMRELGN